MRPIKSSLEINNLTDFDISEDFFSEIFGKTLEKSGVDCLSGKSISISVALVPESEMERLNFDYRKKDSSTDVLSFCEYAKIEDLCNNKKKDVFLGEIILCPKYIERSCVQQSTTFRYELSYILSHGVLHMLCFEHGKEMFSIQEEVSKNI